MLEACPRISKPVLELALERNPSIGVHLLQTRDDLDYLAVDTIVEWLSKSAGPLFTKEAGIELSTSIAKLLRSVVSPYLET